jgi:spermidine synthase
MKPRELLATARIPGGEEMKLYRRGADHMILVERDELMSSRMSGSEEALATLAIARLRGRKAPHLLIGGYGMGFTLRKALEHLPCDGRVTVAELVPEIIDWAKGPMAEMTGDSLSDRRVEIRIGDVADAILEGTYDAILLDVDNGPDGLVRGDNDRLYSTGGLASARTALRPRGILAIWSAAPDPAFTRRLSAARFHVDEEVVRARTNGKGPRHHIWFATPR